MSTSTNLPKTFKAAVIIGANQPLEIKEVPMLEPDVGEILLKVHACGVCHSDHNVLSGAMGPPHIARLGHEFVGTIVALGPTAGIPSKWQVGDLVGGAWHGGHDGHCRSCSHGDFQMCANKQINGVTRDGGYGEYAVLRAEAAVRLPRELAGEVLAQWAPMLCAGVTVFNGMRRMGIAAGDVVAVQGLGGLGHLAVQYARKMGFRTVALSRGEEKRAFAMDLGAHDYIDTAAGNVADELQKLGGAALVIVTAPNAKAITSLVGGLAPRGTLLIHTAIGPVPIDTVSMVQKALTVRGWPSGHALDSEEAIQFARQNSVRCQIEKFPLEKANEAIEHMMSGKARFRAVLTMN
jgi:D-arabinose 1-dehydrogenase-like Zn-dependent alcohol dehydrogenase